MDRLVAYARSGHLRAPPPRSRIHMNKKRLLIAAFASSLPFLSPLPLASQGVTTSTISARVKDTNGNARSGVRVTAVHEPSGSVYQGRTRDDGGARLPGMRVGGPYTVTASGIGFESQTQPNVFLTLGQTSDLQFTMRPTAVQIKKDHVTEAEGPA